MDVGVPFGLLPAFCSIGRSTAWKTERHSDIHVSEPHYEPALVW